MGRNSIFEVVGLYDQWTGSSSLSDPTARFSIQLKKTQLKSITVIELYMRKVPYVNRVAIAVHARAQYW